MKKIVLTLAVMFAATATYAKDNTAATTNNNTAALVQKYDINIDVQSLSRTLGLTLDQAEFADEMSKTFRWDMRHAAKTTDVEKSEKRLNDAINRNLAGMRQILNKDQYRKYLQLMNTTLQNRGIK